jgi:hypothetical protein
LKSGIKQFAPTKNLLIKNSTQNQKIAGIIWAVFFIET